MSSNISDPLPQRLQDLAAKLRPAEPMAAVRLDKLRSAITTPNKDGAAWAASDIYRLIAPNDVAERVCPPVRPDPGLRHLELARNLSILAPLMVTWLGIWHAVEAYRALLGEPGNEALVARPFLLLWQEGFQGRIRIGTLGQLAIVDVLLLAIVLLLTYLTQRRFDAFNQKAVQREREVEDLRADLNDVLAEAQLALAAQYPSEPAQVVAQFNKSIGDLQTELANERQTLRDMITERETELRQLIQEHKQERTSLEAQQQEQQNAMEAFVADFQKGAGDMLASAKSLTPIVDKMAAGVDKLNTQGEAVQKQQDELLARMNATVERLDKLVRAQKGLRSALIAATGTLAVSAGRLDASVKALNDNTPTLTKATTQFNDTASQLMTRQQVLVDTLEKERAALTAVALATKRSTIDLETASERVHKYAKDLYAATVHLNELSNALAPALKAFTDLSSLTKANSDTVDRLAQVMEQVDSAATTVDIAIRSLSPFPPSGDGAS